jgi:2-dehydropantoate 2-reductase
MNKTNLGKLSASDHCRHAVSEMESVDKAWSDLRTQLHDFSMPNWETLRSAMPNWETLHQTYDGRELRA